jgi:fructose-bisphosphate aldolase, class II
MALVSMEVLLKAAKKGKFGVPAFNVWNAESISAVVETAEELNAPAILAGAVGHLEYLGLEIWSAVARTAAERAKVPVAIHLDHGPSLDWVIKCIRAGFTSVMIDSSSKSFEENVAITRRVVELAAPIGVTVEAELGHIPTGDTKMTAELKKECYTVPAEAAKFVKMTGVQALAIACGNLHGLYKFEPELDLDRVAAIAKATPVYLVMHGGSGTPHLPEAIALGIRKVNIGTDFGLGYSNGMLAFADKTPRDQIRINPMEKAGKEGAKAVAKRYMESFGCPGKASLVKW